MSDKNVNVEVDFSYLALALLVIFFWGDPDLCDAMIHYFMSAKP